MPFVRLADFALLARRHVRFVSLARRGARFDNRWLIAVAFAFALSLLPSSRALAQPPQLMPVDMHPSEPVRLATARYVSLPPSVRRMLKQMGGSRAVRVAEGLRAGKYVALRPMFWLTRDRSGAMFALGGLF
jgi:hypothetical protein